MTSKERVMAAFANHPVDKVPVAHIGFSSRVASQLLGREAYVGGGIQQWREACALWNGPDVHEEFLERSAKDAYELAIKTNCDLVRMEYWRMSQPPTRRIDENTFYYGNDQEWRIRRYDLNTELFEVVQQSSSRNTIELKDLDAIVEEAEAAALAYVASPGRYDYIAQADAFSGGKVAVRVGAGGLSVPLDMVWLEAVAQRPDIVSRLLMAQAEYGEKDIALAVQEGAQLIFGGGDMAGNAGTYYSAASFRHIVLPALDRLVKYCENLGVRYLFASDGNMWPVTDLLFDVAQCHGYYEIDSLAGMDLRTLRTRYPHLTLLGNIASITLHTGTRRMVVEETRRCVEDAKELGGVLVGCSNQVVIGTPIENLYAMLETIETYR